MPFCIEGNEEKGMSKPMELLCNKHITIPAANQPNLIGCLNVSVATGKIDVDMYYCI